MSDRTSFVAGGAASAASPTFNLAGAEERLLDKVMELWRRKYPQEVKNFMRDVRLLRETKHKSNGMSLGGTHMLKAAIPIRPWHLINKLCPGFWEREGGVDRFLNTFSRLKLRDPK